jgi:hypothetical protein
MITSSPKLKHIYNLPEFLIHLFGGSAGIRILWIVHLSKWIVHLSKYIQCKTGSGIA